MQRYHLRTFPCDIAAMTCNTNSILFPIRMGNRFAFLVPKFTALRRITALRRSRGCRTGDPAHLLFTPAQMEFYRKVPRHPTSSHPITEHPHPPPPPVVSMASLNFISIFRGSA